MTKVSSEEPSILPAAWPRISPGLTAQVAGFVMILCRLKEPNIGLSQAWFCRQINGKPSPFGSRDGPISGLVLDHRLGLKVLSSPWD